MQIRDILLAPIYIYQGSNLKKKAIRLPEPEGIRHGILTFNNDHLVKSDMFEESTASQIESDNKTLNLMIVGDSAAAGVGVTTQEDAMTGHLLNNLKHSSRLKAKYDRVKWSLHATSGHTSSDLLNRLYVLAKPNTPVDIVVVIIGANDTTSHVKIEQWKSQIEEIIAISKRKFKAKEIIFSCLPPMGNFPAISYPLNKYIGAMSDLLDSQLKDVCDSQEHVAYLEIDFSTVGLDAKDMFAEDGFHPNSTTYHFWSQNLSELIINLLT